MISENEMLYDLLKMLYINSAKKEAQQTELSSFNTFALLFWGQFSCRRMVKSTHNVQRQIIDTHIRKILFQNSLGYTYMYLINQQKAACQIECLDLMRFWCLFSNHTKHCCYKPPPPHMKMYKKLHDYLSKYNGSINTVVDLTKFLKQTLKGPGPHNASPPPPLSRIKIIPPKND